MKNKDYHLIDHTADLGVTVVGGDLSQLYEKTAMAMFDVLVQGAVAPIMHWHDLNIAGYDKADLLVNWLRELLYYWNNRQEIVRQITISDIYDERLYATIGTMDFDADRHTILHEIKAVTYHRILVEKRASGWRTQVFFDL